MLWTMLNLACFFACLFTAVGTAWHAKTSFEGYGLAGIIGLMLGVGSTLALWNIGEWAVVATQGQPERQRKIYLGALYVAGFLWMLIVVLISDYITSAALRLTT